MPAGGHFPLARSRGRQPQPPSVSVRLPVRWFRQWGPGHVASLTQHCFRGSPSGSGQHSVPPDVRVAFRCSVGQLCWPVHPSAHVGSCPPPAAAPCCPSPRSPGSACRPEGAGRAAAPAGSPPGWKPVSHRHAAAPSQGLRVPARAAGRAVARPGAFLRRAKPLCSFNRWAFHSGQESLRAWGPGTVSWLSLAHASVARWLARLCHSLDLWGSGDRRDGLLSMPGAWRTRGPASG